MTDVRTTHRFPGTIGPLKVRSDADSFEATVRDFSIMGVGLLCEHAVLQGVTLTIEGSRFGKPVQPLAAEVRHATQLPSGEWLVGCRFTRHLTMPDLDQLS